MLTYFIKIAQWWHSLQHRLISFRFLAVALIAVVIVFTVSSPAYADIDSYVKRYLKALDPVALDMDGQGHTQEFSAEDLSEGKVLFENHCLNCHVGGSTLPNPTESLALDTLAGATPPRDNINGIVTFLRQPMTYDGSEESFWCRQVPETWMPQEQIEKLAAFVLRAAETAPGWGNEQF
ncbi:MULTISPECIES: photosystem II cytochrome PsbV2 [unclassified Coleofasciculus]|uniref:photosystem II cytochrome PsbV2 n=1 Tax=unclassified Coleofasciculus TaxID=2692782 RepID=UPI00187F8EB1|nr:MULTISPECIES: photosystem II cytochrome PsbV2 [unclassified Coleofasciculus]MBE9128834.1 photosystem II cytochrome PsbV2 [Coleofasciculus sp. LEGE 07081]MBE9148482.1 photosystem II cytochrome PsbV2 [Coleofasciculus sp. LEGE 07092]